MTVITLGREVERKLGRGATRDDGGGKNGFTMDDISRGCSKWNHGRGSSFPVIKGDESKWPRLTPRG